MSGMNSQVHLTLDTYRHQKLREEAERLDMSVNELIRSKLEKPAVPEEIILLRRLKQVLTKKK